MLGIFRFVAESKVHGYVPPLTELFSEYAGNYMVPECNALPEIL